MAGVPKSRDKQLPKEEREKILDGMTVRCSNCDEDLEAGSVSVRVSGDDRYFLFCNYCDLFIKVLDRSKPSLVEDQAIDAVSNAEITKLQEEMFLLKKENELLKKQAASKTK